MTTTRTTDREEPAVPAATTTPTDLDDQVDKLDLDALADVPDDQLPPGVVRRQIDPLSRLTIRELHDGGRRLGVDLFAASRPDHPDRAGCLAVVAWLLARRSDQSVPLGRFTRQTYLQLTADGGPLDLGTELVVDDVEADQVDDDGAVDVEAEALQHVVDADPTDPKRES